MFLVFEVPTVGDLGSDSWQGYQYISGVHYVTTVSNETVPNSNCTFLEELEDGRLRYDCLEADPVWGALTLVIIFLPGLQFYAVYKGIMPKWQLFCGTLCFPVFMIIQKVNTY